MSTTPDSTRPDIEFVDALPDRRRAGGRPRRDWPAAEDALKARSGEWAILDRREINEHTPPQRASARVSSNTVARHFRHLDGFEMATRSDDEVCLYVRYVGAES